MKDQFRIVESYIETKTKGTIRFFYPQRLEFSIKTTGMWWWKKHEPISTWKYLVNFKRPFTCFTSKEEPSYYERENLVGFQTMDEAKVWLESYIEDVERDVNYYSNQTWKHLATHNEKIIHPLK